MDKSIFMEFVCGIWQCCQIAALYIV